MRVFRRWISVSVIAVLLGCLCAFFGGCSLFGNKKSGDILPHLIEEAQKEENPVRPIDGVSTRGFTTTTLAAQYDELLEIVYKPQSGTGYRPDFTQALPEVKEVYEAAVAVLDRYIRNDFSDYDRVHAIHDYLAYTVTYDFDLLASSNIDRDDPSFGLAGVFVNHKAVCDGFSKAFLLLCGIEQISCIRVTGSYYAEGEYIDHAWNKVNIRGVWYNVDATMDSWHAKAGKQSYNLLNHGYFLVSDADMRDPLTGHHVEGDNLPVNYACDTTYPFHKTTALGIGTYSMEITDQASLNDVFTQIKKSKRKIGKAELKLNFTDAEISLDRPEAYATQIAEAYKKVSDADFRMDADTATYPYYRYPNGVFVFLIYK